MFSLLDLLRGSVTAVVVLSAVETVTIGAVITCEMLGIQSGWRLPSRWEGRCVLLSSRLDSMAFLVGQVFVGAASVGMVVLLMTAQPAASSHVVRIAGLASIAAALLAMALAFVAGVTAVDSTMGHTKDGSNWSASASNIPHAHRAATTAARSRPDMRSGWSPR
jgi:hypothetical protein